MAKFTESWDYVQENHKCCGQFGWNDYASKNASNWFSTKFGVGQFAFISVLEPMYHGTKNFEIMTSIIMLNYIHISTIATM